ncbi:MAG: RNA polymerase sigma factor [bacterium]|nr:RNA polymerase sigma factor [bacterium]
MKNDAGPPDEAAVIARARGGDDEAFRQLVETHSREVFRLAYRLTGNQENAEDVVQETFLRAYRALHRFDARSRFSTWLHRITANCAMDLLRRSRRDPRWDGPDDEIFDTFASTEPGPERLTLSAEIERRVRSGLAKLTPTERTAFVLRHFEQQSIADIGRVLGSRTSATKQAVFRAVHKLRQELAPWVEENHVQVA